MTIAWRMISDRRRSILYWTIGAIVLVALIALAYPSIRDTGDEFQSYVDSLPEGLQQAFGLAGASLASPEGYLASQLYSNTYPVVLLILGLGMAGWSVAGSESDGTLEVALANPVSRTSLGLERFCGLALIVGFVGAVSNAVLALLMPLFDLDEGLPWWAIWSAALQCFCFVLVLCAVAFAVGAATGSKSLAIAASAGWAVAGYLIQALSSTADFFQTLQWLSPWYWFLRDNPMTTAPNLLNTALPLALAAVLVGLGVAAFERRDLKLA